MTVFIRNPVRQGLPLTQVPPKEKNVQNHFAQTVEENAIQMPHQKHNKHQATL